MSSKKSKTQVVQQKQQVDTQTLPSREASSFRQLIKLYEAKQFKKGIKTADSILAKQPEHGETLAMKGLLIHYQNKKQEAQDLVKKGLQFNLKSHVCWHVYGMLNRFEKNYDMALKCYKQALNLSPDNIQYMRDLSQLQIQVRDIAGLIESRNQILSSKPNNRAHWITLVVAYQLDKNHDMALKILELYENSIEEKPTTGQDAYEYSELILYKAQLYKDSSQYHQVLETLQKQSKYIKDKVGMKEMQAEVNDKLKQHKDSSELYRQLIAINPENYIYHQKYQEQLKLAEGMSSEQQYEFLKDLYQQLQQKYPYSNACKRIPLDFLEGKDFIIALDQQSRRFISKEIPSLHNNFINLYKDPFKCLVIEQLFIEYLKYIYAHGELPTQSSSNGAQVGDTQGHTDVNSIISKLADLSLGNDTQISQDAGPQGHTDINSIVSKLSDLSTGHDQKYSGHLPNDNSIREMEPSPVNQNGVTSIGKKNLEENNNAPEVLTNGVLIQEGKENIKSANGNSDNSIKNKLLGWVTYFMAQHYLRQQNMDLAVRLGKCAIFYLDLEADTLILYAKILKRAGDIVGSYEIADNARKLDMQDRYINTQAVRRLFQGDQVQRAEKTYTYFTKDNEYISSFFDMQNIWYEVKCGQAHQRLGNYGKALKNFTSIKKHFDDFNEDQIDFHQYCMRRLTLRSYQDFIDTQDRLQSHNFFALGAFGTVQCYLKLHEDQVEKTLRDNQDLSDDMSPDERKKLKLKQKKEAQRSKQQQEKELGKLQEQKQNQEAVKPQGSQQKNKKDGKQYKDTDPNGLDLINVEDKLQEAQGYIKSLNQFHGRNLQTHYLSMQYFLFKQKMLLALRSIIQALKISDESNPKVHEMIVKFGASYEKYKKSIQETDQVSDVMIEIIDKRFQTFLNGESLQSYNQKYIEKYSNQSLESKFSALKMKYHLDSNAAEVVSQQISDSQQLISQSTHQECQDIHDYLHKQLQLNDAADNFYRVCQKHFKYSRYFEGQLVLDYESFLETTNIILKRKALDKEKEKEKAQRQKQQQLA